MLINRVTVMIPLGGKGMRFVNAGYKQPKPFVKARGKEILLWLCDNLTLEKDDALVFVYNPNYMNMGNYMKDLIKPKYPNAIFVELPGFTRGSVETVRYGLSKLPIELYRRPLLLLDGDTFYNIDIIGKYKDLIAKNLWHSAVGVFKDEQSAPIYSYSHIDNHFITDIKEKLKISDWANSGAYAFTSGEVLDRHCNVLLRRKPSQLSQDGVAEYYISGVIDQMIHVDSLKVVPIYLEKQDFTVLGTPENVALFENIFLNKT